MSIAKSIEEMIQQRAASGPQMIKDYGSSLETAATQDQQSIDDLRGIYSDPSKFSRSTIGALGLGLMAPTKSGNFGETMYNAMSSAIDTQNYNREQNLSREEKLAKLSALQAQLTRQQANDQIGVYDKQTSWITNAQNDQKTLSDVQLSGGLPGAEGTDPMARSMEIYNDYLANPTKYAGPQGQAMVDDAITFIKNERLVSSREKIAEMRQAEKPTVSGPEQRRISKRIGDLDTDAENARQLKASVAALQAARSKTGSEGGAFADTWASVGGWFGNDNASNMQTVRSLATEMKLNLSQKLKGSVSNAEQGMLENATPGLQMTDDAATPVLQGYSLAAERVTERAKFMRSWVQKNGDDYGADEAWDQYVNENPIISADKDGNWTVNDKNVGNWQRYVIDVNAEDGPPQASGVDTDLGFDPALLTPEDRAWAQEQIDGGADPQAVIEELRSTYGNGN